MWAETKQFGPSFARSDWDPTPTFLAPSHSLVGTLITALEAMLLAVPLGLGTAIFLSEMSDRSTGRAGSGFRSSCWQRFRASSMASGASGSSRFPALLMSSQR